MIPTLLLIGLTWIVFRGYLFSARRFNVFDIPNSRSSHDQITLRGAGILFPLAWIGFSLANGFFLPYFTTGLFLIALISFLDDVRSQTIPIRVGFHITAIALATVELYQVQALPWYIVPLAAVVFFVTINIVNFMDGINGMLGIQSLVFLLSVLIYKNRDAGLDYMLSYQSPFPYLFASVLVFGYYNFRKKALVFSGDVGSISSAYIMVFVIACTVLGISLVTPSTVPGSVTGNYVFDGFDLRYLLLLGVFYVDAGVTILHRLLKGEKITTSHRKHLYQFLVNELQWPHLVVSSLYGVVQLGLSLLVLFYMPDNDGFLVIAGLLVALYVTLRMKVMQEISRREALQVIRSGEAAPAIQTDPNPQVPAVKLSKAALAATSPLLPMDSVYRIEKTDLLPLDSMSEEAANREPVENASTRRITFGNLSVKNTPQSSAVPQRNGDFNP